MLTKTSREIYNEVALNHHPFKQQKDDIKWIAVDSLIEMLENELISCQEEITSKYSNKKEQKESTFAYKIIEKMLNKVK